MRKRLFLLSLLFLFSCSAGIHKYFRYNNFTSAANTYIINDSLKLYIRMPIDYNFVTDSKKLKRVIKKHKKEVSHLENVLVYGKTYVDPFYEIFITAGPGPKPQARKRNVVVLDTVLNKMPIYVVAINRDENAPNSFKIDASQILNSMRVGKNYRKNMLSVMDLSRRFEKTNRFLEAYNEIKNYPDSDRQQYWLKLQMQITYASFLGNHPDYTGLLKKFERPGERDSVYNAIEKKAVWNDDVYQKILEAAGHHKIIMFNENHFMPQHRLLLLNLLPELKKLGYRYSNQSTPRHSSIKDGFLYPGAKFCETYSRCQKTGI